MSPKEAALSGVAWACGTVAAGTVQGKDVADLAPTALGGLTFMSIAAVVLYIRNRRTGVGQIDARGRR